ncbi:MAG TPA: LysE family transporter [Kofleriaceae bacterium]|nr:LysE family transporter [Kofleriaceae bacterium]
MFLVIGVAAGALTGVPIGPVNVAVIDAAYRHTYRRAMAVGFGGALADALYAALGVMGVTPFLRTYPTVLTVIYAVSGIVLMVYGWLTARSQPVAPAAPTNPDDHAPTEDSVVFRRRELKQGFTLGIALILLNPAAVVTWVVIMGSVIPDTSTHWDGLACAVGVFVGSFAWFSLVAYLTQKGKHVLGDKAAWIPRVVGVALMIYAVYLLAKAVKFVVA